MAATLQITHAALASGALWRATRANGTSNSALAGGQGTPVNVSM